MPQSNAIPTLSEAEALLDWAEASNPGPWAEHSRVAARAAAAIAAHCGLDAERARILGLLHDIGRYEGVRGLHHVIAGHSLAMQRIWPGVARICLTHSFPIPELDSFAGRFDCSPEELAMLRAFLSGVRYDIYDALIQLCDAIALPGGVALMDARLMDVALRHGVSELALPKWRAFYALKARFDALCGFNIYALFRDEILRGVFG